MSTLNPLKVISLTLVALFVLCTDSQAYLDAGTSSYILQIIITGIVAVVVGVKSFWYQIKAFFGAKKSTSTEEPPQD